MQFKKLYTLVFIRDECRILLGMKKRGFGCNKWNGFGGKVEPDESIVAAAVRELKEECCVQVKPTDLKSIGHLEFTFEGEPLTMDVRVFSATVYEGTPRETEEMAPKWFCNDQIPFNDMWPDDKIWFPYMLKGILFHGAFHYQGFDTILNYRVNELESMESHYSSLN